MYDVDFLVEFIHGATDVNTVNQALSLLTTVAGACPDIVLQHVITVFSILGETTLVQVCYSMVCLIFSVINSTQYFVNDWVYTNQME
jgi:hypothetical protein